MAQAYCCDRCGHLYRNPNRHVMFARRGWNGDRLWNPNTDGVEASDVMSQVLNIGVGYQYSNVGYDSLDLCDNCFESFCEWSRIFVPEYLYAGAAKRREEE